MRCHTCNGRGWVDDGVCQATCQDCGGTGEEGSYWIVEETQPEIVIRHRVTGEEVMRVPVSRELMKAVGRAAKAEIIAGMEVIQTKPSSTHWLSPLQAVESDWPARDSLVEEREEC